MNLKQGQSFGTLECKTLCENIVRELNQQFPVAPSQAVVLGTQFSSLLAHADVPLFKEGFASAVQ